MQTKMRYPITAKRVKLSDTALKLLSMYLAVLNNRHKHSKPLKADAVMGAILTKFLADNETWIQQEFYAQYCDLVTKRAFLRPVGRPPGSANCTKDT